MNIDYWSREEIKAYRENPNLLFSKANELRSQVISQLLKQLLEKIVLCLKSAGRKMLGREALHKSKQDVLEMGNRKQAY